jgi:hypothetical protein
VKLFSLIEDFIVERGSGDHPASHSMGTGGYFLWVRAVGA